MPFTVSARPSFHQQRATSRGATEWAVCPAPPSAPSTCAPSPGGDHTLVEWSADHACREHDAAYCAGRWRDARPSWVGSMRRHLGA